MIRNSGAGAYLLKFLDNQYANGLIEVRKQLASPLVVPLQQRVQLLRVHLAELSEQTIFSVGVRIQSLVRLRTKKIKMSRNQKYTEPPP